MADNPSIKARTRRVSRLVPVLHVLLAATFACLIGSATGLFDDGLSWIPVTTGLTSMPISLVLAAIADRAARNVRYARGEAVEAALLENAANAAAIYCWIVFSAGAACAIAGTP